MNKHVRIVDCNLITRHDEKLAEKQAEKTTRLESLANRGVKLTLEHQAKVANALRRLADRVEEINVLRFSRPEALYGTLAAEISDAVLNGFATLPLGSLAEAAAETDIRLALLAAEKADDTE